MAVNWCKQLDTQLLILLKALDYKQSKAFNLVEIIIVALTALKLYLVYA